MSVGVAQDGREYLAKFKARQCVGPGWHRVDRNLPCGGSRSFLSAYNVLQDASMKGELSSHGFGQGITVLLCLFFLLLVFHGLWSKEPVSRPDESYPHLYLLGIVVRPWRGLSLQLTILVSLSFILALSDLSSDFSEQQYPSSLRLVPGTTQPRCPTVITPQQA